MAAGDDANGTRSEEASVGAVAPWSTVPIFDPMPGASQLGDARRIAHVAACFGPAFKKEADRVEKSARPGAVERMWGRSVPDWASLAMIVVAWPWLASRASKPEMLALATVSLIAWSTAVSRLLLIFLPSVVLGLDPTRPHWAKRSVQLDPEFVAWAKASLAVMGEKDRVQAALLAPQDARGLFDAMRRLEQARSKGTWRE